MTTLPQKTPWVLVFALWGAGLGAAAQYGKMSVIFDLLPLQYPQAGMALGLVVSIVGFVGIFLGVAAGLMVARIRFRRALLWALWGGAAMSLVQAALPPLPWMLVSRMIEGLSHLGLVVAIPTLIAQLCAPRDRGIALSVWSTFFGVAFAILAIIGRPVVDAFGIPGLLIGHAAFMAGCALYLSAHLRRLAIASPPEPFSLAVFVRNHANIYRSAAIAAPAAGWLFYTFCFLAILTVLPPYLEPDIRAWVIGLMPLVNILSSMTLGVALLRVTSAVNVILLGFGASAVAALWLLSAPTPVACLALSVCLGLVQGASFAAVPQLNGSPAAQAQANGAMAQAGNIGNTLGVPVMVLATSAIGYIGLPLLACVAFVFGGLVHLLLARRRNAA